MFNLSREHEEPSLSRLLDFLYCRSHKPFEVWNVCLFKNHPKRNVSHYWNHGDTLETRCPKTLSLVPFFKKKSLTVWKTWSCKNIFQTIQNTSSYSANVLHVYHMLHMFGGFVENKPSSFESVSLFSKTANVWNSSGAKSPSILARKVPKFSTKNGLMGHRLISPTQNWWKIAKHL